MYKTISILSLVLTALTAAPTTNTTASNAGAKAVPYFRFGTSGTEHNEMAVSIQNLTGANARVTLEMYSEKGELVQVPYFAGPNEVARSPRQSEVFGPHVTRVWRTSSKGEELKRGWLRVISEPAGAFAVLVHGNTAFNGGNLEQMFTVHQQAGAPVQFLSRFDNGALDHLVVANNSSAPDQLTMIARAADGSEMCRTKLSMKPAQYYKHYAKSYLACTDGKAASVEIQSETGAAVAMAFVYPVQGAPLVIQPQAPAQTNSEMSLEDKLTELYNKLKKSAGY